MKYFFKKLFRGLLLIIAVFALMGIFGNLLSGNSRGTSAAVNGGNFASSLMQSASDIFTQLRKGEFNLNNTSLLKTQNSQTSKQTDSTTPIESNVQNVSLSNVYYYRYADGVPDSVKNVFAQAIQTYNDTGIVKLVPGNATHMQNSILMSTYDENTTSVSGDTVDMELGRGGPETFQSALGDWVHGTAKLNIYYPSAISVSVATHELGHALGLGHSSDPNSVMYPTDQGMTQLTNADLATLRAIYEK